MDKNFIYQNTNNGLDIFRYYFIFLSEDYAITKKKFRLRDEKDASASIRLYNGCYRIIDFGDDSKEFTPIDFVMKEENLNFFEACKLIYNRHNIPNDKPIIKKQERITRPAREDEKEGDFFIDEKDFSDNEIKIMGKTCTSNVLKSLNWISLRSYTIIKNKEAITKFSNESNPILARKCIFIKDGKEEFFYKIYQPKNEKQYRFQYIPAGKKPRNYINGLHELKQDWKEENEEKEQTNKKFDNVVLCSGERDSANLKARGMYPIWLNSETADLTEEMYREIMHYTNTLYNVPDIDTTGIKQGKALALRYIDICTIWLPESIQKYNDWRGNPFKDFRDWTEIYPTQKDFNNIINLALPAKFWTYQKGNYVIDIEALLYFLRINDFFIYKDPLNGQYQFKKQKGQIIYDVTTKDIRNFLKEWARNKFLPKEIRNTIIGNKIQDSFFDNLDYKDLNLEKSSNTKQYLFFLNETWKITRDGIIAASNDNVSILEHSVIPHNVSILPHFFEIKKNGENIDITILNTESKYFCFLINSSRIYWRAELEDSLSGLDENFIKQYKEKYKFAIKSPYLTEEQNNEQILCLLSKMHAIGYYLHNYKSPSSAWAAYAMDWKLDENGINNGRSGKSFFFKFADIFLKVNKLSGRNKKLLDNAHVFDQVTQHTDMVLIDDCNKYITPDLFFDNITSDLTINPKNQKSYTIPFEKSPKFAFTTNYVPRQFDPSSVGRLLFLVFSDYYHIKALNTNYNEDRQIYDDFGKSLFNDYNEHEFNADFNFFAQCLVFYLECQAANYRPRPILDNIIKRSYKASMSESFEDWATSYFAAESTNIDKFIDRQQVFNMCKLETGNNKMSSQMFMKQLRSFIELSDHLQELNPVELCGSAGRIIKNIKGESREMLYIKSKKQ